MHTHDNAARGKRAHRPKSTLHAINHPRWEGMLPADVHHQLSLTGIELSPLQIARCQQYRHSTTTATMAWKEFGYRHPYEEGPD